MGCFFIADQLFMVRAWTPLLEREIAELKTIPIWLNFYNVPIHMWNVKGLSLIASYIGNPIMSDKNTLSRQRMNYAIVCVEIDVNCAYPSEVPLIVGGKRITIHVEYPWKPPRCSHCGIFGRSLEKCIVKPKVVVAQTEKVGTQQVEGSRQVWKKKTSKRNGDDYLEEISEMEVIEEMVMEPSPPPVGLVKEKVIQFSKENVNTTSSQRKLVEVPIQVANKFAALNSEGTEEENNVIQEITVGHASTSNVMEIHDQAGGVDDDLGGGVRSHFAQKPVRPAKVLESLKQVAGTCLVETHVQANNSSRIMRSICPSWKFFDNYFHSPAGRIWVGWDPEVLQVSLIQNSSQAIFLDVNLPHNISCVFTFVYGDNDGIVRRSLWNDLVSFSCYNKKPWMILGDFNAILEYKDRLSKTEITASQYSDFFNCTQDAQIFDLAYTGCFYTWINLREGEASVMGKIDRVLVNLEWIHQFQDSMADFLNPGVSDHSPSVVTCFEGRAHGPPPFRFCNYLDDDEEFLKIVEFFWKDPVQGNPMVVLVTNLKRTKKRLNE
ncbi:uncharacterized protein LOC113324182 [Papaver somniferum]|uniref:uncharacterized protein LOC113324182 n=1 Tax=Papaver somniferum TaxID=3469 RepID=UPI000E6F47DD|nr:uncharacterized protein LOC113324182 [Papaver somniferum]